MTRIILEQEATQSIAREFAGVYLGDDRRRDRLCFIAEALSKDPALSFPRVFADDAELEATYRFFANPEISFKDILRPHTERTFFRLAQAEFPLVIHDTTQLCFDSDHVKGLGRVGGTTAKGFFCHTSLAVDFRHGVALPVGLANAELFRRLGRSKGKRNHSQLKHDHNRESLRWWHGVEKVESQTDKKPIHVMDREADAYWLLCELTKNQDRFVIRISKNRGVEGEESLLFDQMDKATWLCEREVYVSSRRKLNTPQMRKLHPPRSSRLAKLSFSSQEVVIKRGRHVGVEYPESIKVNVVLVREVSPPEGEEPVEWRLITCEPIENVEDTLRIVDIYRCRWTIEEYFKALKSGCCYEQRQLESYDSLSNALAVFMPIAWRVLLLRSLERQAPLQPATLMLSEEQIIILRAISKRPVPTNPTIQDIFQAIARLGGHIKNNGAPGWQVLWRGYQKFLSAELGWKAAKKCGAQI